MERNTQADGTHLAVGSPAVRNGGTMKVRAGSSYIFYPNFLDRVDGRLNQRVIPGQIVTVVNLPGCPPANTMDHAHIKLDGIFAGLVHTNSLYRLSDAPLVITAIKSDIARQEARQ